MWFSTIVGIDTKEKYIILGQHIHIKGWTIYYIDTILIMRI